MEENKKEVDNRLLGICLHNYSDALVIDGQFSEAKKLLLQLKGIPEYKWDIYDFCNIAEIYNKENKIDSVIYYINKAKECISIKDDSIFIYRVMYEMNISKENYKKAVGYMEKMNTIQDSIAEVTIEQSVIKNHRDYMEQEAELAKKDAIHKKHKLIFLTISSVALVTILLLILLYYYEKMKRKNAEIAHTIEAIHDANNIINNQKREIETTQQQIAKVFSGQFALLDELLNTYLDHEGSNRNTIAVFKDVEKRIASFSSQNKLDELKDIVNENMNNVAERLQQQVPNINNNELNLFLYLCAQFSPRVIALFMSDKLENIYNKKSRLKRKIQNSNATDKEEFLRLF